MDEKRESKVFVDLALSKKESLKRLLKNSTLCMAVLIVCLSQLQILNLKAQIEHLNMKVEKLSSDVFLTRDESSMLKLIINKRSADTFEPNDKNRRRNSCICPAGKSS